MMQLQQLLTIMLKKFNLIEHITIIDKFHTDWLCLMLFCLCCALTIVLMMYFATFCSGLMASSLVSIDGKSILDN